MLSATLRLLTLLVALLVTTWATNADAQTSHATPAPMPSEEEAPDSPRADVRNFLDLAERGRYDEAARYLDVPRSAASRAGEIARKLHTVLGERLWVDPESLSPRPEGKKDDNLPPGTEELGKIKDARGRVVSIRIVRHEPTSPEDEARWVFSQTTVQAVDILYASLRGYWLRERMPAFLRVPGPKALYLWQWLALPVLALLCYLVGRVLAFAIGLAARTVTRRVHWAPSLLHSLRSPVRLGLALLAFWLLVPYLALTLRAEDLLERLLKALGWLAFFWALVRAVAVAGDAFVVAPYARSRPSVRSLTSVGVSLGKVVVFALALMVALSELGYPVTSVVAGLGIGGVALALAAQKTVENLFGSLSILVDQPFRVGDVIKVDTIEGTVETIGLRSTRLRTADRTLIIIPNGKLADMRIESLGPRDRIRFVTKLSLARSATPEQLRRVVVDARAVLVAAEKVLADEVYVRFTGFGESSFDIDVTAMLDTRDFGEFARLREELLLKLLGVVDQAGAQIAVPVRAMLDVARDGAPAQADADRPDVA